MTKISKFLLFIFTILCLITYISSVKAETCTPVYNVLPTTNYQTTNTSNNTQVQFDITFANNYQFNQYEYYRILYLKINNWTNYDMTIDYNTTCSGQNWGGYTDSYTITYQDGSTARVSGTDYDLYCNASGNHGQISGYQVNDSTIINGALITSNNNISGAYIQNDLNSNTFKIYKNNDIQKGIRITLNKSNQNTSYRFGILRPLLFGCNGDSQNIIDNQNQNAQQQHQDSQNINNSITSSDVSGNTSNDTITSISNTFDSENDFLLNLLTIPYTFWTSITNVFSNSCSALNIGTMFDKPLVFPCIELNDYLGSVFTTIIDVIFSGIAMSAFVRRIIRYYQALLSLDNSASIIGGVKIW